MDVFVKIVQLLLSLSILVLFHEFGHLLFAKLFKTRVEKFYMFFNPWFSLFKFKKGETEYGIGWLPLGEMCIRDRCVTGRHTDTRFFFTEGYNPYYITEKYLVTSLKESVIPGYDWDEVEEVHFYGAGCAEDKYDFMRNAFAIDTLRFFGCCLYTDDRCGDRSKRTDDLRSGKSKIG